MKKRSRPQPKRHKNPHSSHRRVSAAPTGLLQSSAIACGIGLASGTAASLIFALISLVFGFNSGIISALGYVSAVICFAVCGYVAGKLGRAALPSGIVAACIMTVVSILISILPLPAPTHLAAFADILVRLGLAAVTIICAIFGSNK